MSALSNESFSHKRYAEDTLLNCRNSAICAGRTATLPITKHPDPEEFTDADYAAVNYSPV